MKLRLIAQLPVLGIVTTPFRVLSALIVDNTVRLTRSAVACPSGEMHCWVRCSVLCCDGVVVTRWC